MSKLQNFILAPDQMNEAAYHGNIGFEEMVKFYGKATKAEIIKMELFIKENDWDGFKSIIKKVVGVALK